jgi:dipeptidyl-peptidase-4
VDAVVHVDERRGLVFYTSGRQDPRERHLYSLSLRGERPQTLHSERGFHGGVFAADGSHYAHWWESVAQPSRIEVLATEGGVRSALYEAEVPAEVRADLPAPRFVELSADDGTRLFGAIYQPPAGEGPWPTVVSVYGGPHAQMVTNTWGMTIDLRAQYLASLGFLVFKLDNRGAARRGLAFEAAVYRRAGTVEVADQVAGVNWLIERGLTDPARVGIYGWSYGGFLSAMCLLKAPATFKAAAAGAPVAHWDGYDTHYTERYMSTPAENPDGYRNGALTTHASELQGKLLIIHGLVDENVHFRHSARFIAALEHAGKELDLLLLPEERHSVRPTPQNLPVRRMIEERVVAFFQKNL